jgi:hypothetical protein
VVASRPRAPAEDRAGSDPKQPPEDGREDDGPDKRHHGRTDYLTELDLMRVGSRECDQADEQRDGDERLEVQSSPVNLAAKALAARLHRSHRSGRDLPWDTLTCSGRHDCLHPVGQVTGDAVPGTARVTWKRHASKPPGADAIAALL